jgi:hypothetical protein
MLDGVADGVERALAPIDAGRRWLYRATVPALGGWVLDRERRVVVLAAIVMTTSLLGALVLPVPMLAVGPILLGVPHLVADFRYLVVQPGLHRRGPMVWIVGALLASTPILNHLAPAILGAAVAVLALARASLARRALVAAPLLGLAGLAVADPRAVTLAFGHLHNLVAIGLWVVIASVAGRPGNTLRLQVGLAFVAMGAAIFVGAFDPLLDASLRIALPVGPKYLNLARTLSPTPDPTWAARWVALFCFAQSVHYGLWLRLIPEDVRPRPAPRSFQTSWAVLRQDFGTPLMLAFLALCAALAIWAVADLQAARIGYLRLVLFHGPLELVTLGLLLAEGRTALGGGR